VVMLSDLPVGNLVNRMKGREGGLAPAVCNPSIRGNRRKQRGQAHLPDLSFFPQSHDLEAGSI
jgi:hypothetical protein